MQLNFLSIVLNLYPTSKRIIQILFVYFWMDSHLDRILVFWIVVSD